MRRCGTRLRERPARRPRLLPPRPRRGKMRARRECSLIGQCARRFRGCSPSSKARHRCQSRARHIDTVRHFLGHLDPPSDLKPEPLLRRDEVLKALQMGRARLPNKEFVLVRTLRPSRTGCSRSRSSSATSGAFARWGTRTLDSHASRHRRKLDPDGTRYAFYCWGVPQRQPIAVRRSTQSQR